MNPKHASTPMRCTLCLGEKINSYFEKNEKSYGFRKYYQCQVCELVFQDPKCHVDLALEKTIYSQHENSINNQGYVSFLNKLTQPMLTYLKPKQKGLDFGSGPGPTLCQIFAQHGFAVDNYDPIFADNKNLLQQTYDFITCTEVAEHFHYPHKDFSMLVKLLKPSGYMGIMTQTLTPNVSFGDWWYHRDPTHVSFYCLATFKWIEQRFRLNLIYSEQDIFIFQKH